MENLRAILAGCIADTVVTINLQYVQILIHLCHPYAIWISHVANAGAITGSRLVECRLNHRCKKSTIAIVDDAGEGDLLTIACDVFRPDGLGMIEFHPIIRDVPEGEGCSVVSLSVGRNLTSNTGQQLTIEEAIVGEAGVDAELTQFGELRIIRCPAQSISQTGKLLLINHADGIVVVEYPGIFCLWQFHDVVSDVKIACRQTVGLHDVFCTIVGLYGNEVRTLPVLYCFIRTRRGTVSIFISRATVCTRNIIAAATACKPGCDSEKAQE